MEVFLLLPLLGIMYIIMWTYWHCS
eukprot:COSAG01_NODE_34266_length_550_cov_1.372506_1_plen_24_part_01